MDEEREPLVRVYNEAQQAVIGSLLIDPEHVLGPVMDALGESAFDGEWRTLFAAIRALWLRQEPVDAVTVLDAAGPAYEARIRDTMRMTPTAANVMAYVRVVRDQSRLLDLHHCGAQLLSAADEGEARQILTKAEELLSERQEQRVFSLQDLFADFYRRMDGPKPVYLPWGIKALDEKLTAELGDMVVLGADSSVGKTALALQFAWNMAARSYRVGFFSLETKSSKLANRIMAQRARLPSERIKRGDYADEDYRTVLELANGAGKMRLDVVQASGFTAEEIRAVTVARRYQVIFIDYLQLVQGRGDSRPEIVTDVSIALHTMAQDLGVTVIALSQITPADKTKKARQRPGKEDLRESRQIIHDADIILMMSLAKAEDPGGNRWLNCAKNKEGELPSVCLSFDAPHMWFQATDSRALDAYYAKRRAAKFTELPDNGQEEIPWP